MRALKRFLSALFALSACSCFGMVLEFVRADLYPWYVWTQPMLLRRLLVPVLFAILGFVFSAACWTGFREAPASRGWGIAASAVIVLAALVPYILYFLYDEVEGLWSGIGITLPVLGVGVAGIVAFARPIRKDEKAGENESAPRPGDGTNGLMNKAAGLVAFALSYGAFSWWLRWIRSSGIRTESNLFWDNVTFFAVVAIVVVLHELGHAAGGLMLGMKIRLFALGPFEWSRTKCQWKFEFKIRKMAGRDGAVGLVPTQPRSPRWHGAWLAAAGPAANLVTGTIALGAGLTSSPDSPLNSYGILSLFGAMSLAVGITSLIPFRLRRYYSDGARCFQHLSNYPMSDFMRVIQLVTAVQQTTLRPRDYDLGAIEHALQGFPSCMEGHYLKLYEFDCYFDQGRFSDAARALTEAEAIYDSCALQAETEISFVLGHGCLRDDPVSARRWWERFEVRNPDRSDAGYWHAKCALDCTEGRHEDAIAALREADALIAILPPTGSRAYDMEWSAQLREAMQRIPETAIADFA